jgi:hypothetical protein
MDTRPGFSIVVDIGHDSDRAGGDILEVSLYCARCNRLILSWRPPTPLDTIEREADRHPAECNLGRKGKR